MHIDTEHDRTLLNAHVPSFPDASPLELAVSSANITDVYAMLSACAAVPDPVITNSIFSALLRALKLDRPDIVSLLLAARYPCSLPLFEAVNVGFTSNFQAFLWHGWDINEPARLDKSSILGYA